MTSRFLVLLLALAGLSWFAPVYAAGEDPIPGASRDDLVAGLIRHGHRHARRHSHTDTAAGLAAHAGSQSTDCAGEPFHPGGRAGDVDNPR